MPLEQTFFGLVYLNTINKLKTNLYYLPMSILAKVILPTSNLRTTTEKFLLEKPNSTFWLTRESNP